jgi:membrane associated rhomboid family serine protease
MGIYDREYYRREGPSFLGSLAEQGKAWTWLLGLNIVCFIAQMATRPDPATGAGWVDGSFSRWLVLVPDLVLRGEVWRLLTYAFLHDIAPWHIVFNMLMLWLLGRQVEDMLGSREFVLFYLLGGVLAGVAYVGCALAGLHPMNSAVLGASGAVMAVLVVAACYHPRQIIYVMFVLPVPIWAFAVFYLVNDAFHLVGRMENGVATSAHLGGAAFGFLYYKLGWRLAGLLRLPARSRPRLRLYREDEERVPVARASAPALYSGEDEQLEAQVDDILAKIPRVGMEGLTEQERQVLLRASEAIKRRRG